MRIPADPWIKVLAMVLSWVWGFAEHAFAIHNRRETGAASQEKDKGSFYVITLSIAAGMTVACMFAFSGIGALRHPRWWEAAGALLLLAGAGVRLHAIRALARHFTSRVTVFDDHTLVREGAYRWIRHPSYLGQILLLVGLGALMANAVALVVAPLFTTIALLIRIRVEEHALAEHFGEAYEDYRRTTARLVPFVW
jgi:protein-S-isoprenylcysteine O-methyltransferase Ste14